MAKVRIGGLVFDAIIKTDHTSKVTATSHPVEYGANISDHAYVEPAEISIEVAVSNTERRSTFGKGDRAKNAFVELMKLQHSRKLIAVSTRYKTYTNMLITSISVPDDYLTMDTFRASIMLKEILVVTTSKVKVSERGSAQSHKTGSTNGGTKQPTTAKQSVLKQATGALKGR